MPASNKTHIPLLSQGIVKSQRKAITIPAVVKPRQTASIIYDAAREKLSGYIGNIYFDETVYSGGSRGHKEVTNVNKAKSYLHHESNSLKSRLSTTKMKEEVVKGKKNFVQRGGTLPPGHYVCQYRANHPTFKECIFLAQKKDALAIYTPYASAPIAHNRDGFFIHGAGPKGSDGCLVFPHLANERRKLLNQTVNQFEGQVILEVVNVSYMLPAEIGGYTT